jgi:oxygen-independent coproporphyrinogen-3 oxidase
MSHSLREMLAAAGAFQGYAYAYPHKTAYRRLEPTRPLKKVWAQEEKDALFLYAHVPFCEMRCGFCNLFTVTHPGESVISGYLAAMERQAEAVRGALGPSARFARLALGGGTPTFLSVGELARLFEILNRAFLEPVTTIPKVIEASPATVDEEKIAFLKAQGIARVSLGVQSFLEPEVRALGRAQRTQEVRRALGLLAAAGFQCLNVDLIYGIPGQTAETWRRSLEETLEFAPQEIYLYPLYVRPLTHLDRIGSQPTDARLDLYRIGRDFLQAQGYEQISMRLFRRQGYKTEGPIYCCQEDGMVGIGPGARSYTRALHYSSEYAVGRPGILDIIADYNGRTSEQFAEADYGCELDSQEQKRRYVLKSLLRSDGLDLRAYAEFFGAEVFEDFPQFFELIEEGLAASRSEACPLTPALSLEGEGDKRRLRLTAAGMELSDVIGPWLWSAGVRERMNEFALR